MAPEDKAIRGVLTRTDAAGNLELATLVSILLCRLPVPARVLALAADIVSSSGAPQPGRGPRDGSHADRPAGLDGRRR